MICLSDLLTQPDVIIDFLKREIVFKEIGQRIMAQQMIRQAAEARSISVTEAEIPKAD
jgi:hypothetical protein